jgi:acetyl esterase/lipase
VSDLQYLIYAALAGVIRENPILSAIPVDEESPDAYFVRLPSIDLQRSVFFIKRCQPLVVADTGEDRELDIILQDQHNTNFKSDYGSLPFWRLLILTTPGVQNQFTASFIFHHAIGDGVSGLIFHNAFRDALEVAYLSPSSLDPKFEHITTSNGALLLPPLEELHPLPIQESPTKPPTTTLKEWTGNAIHPPCKSRYKTLYLSPSSSTAFVQECKKRNLSVTSALSSLVATVLFGILPPTTEALTCIIPVNLRPWLQLTRDMADKAIGTYFDAFKVQQRRTNQNIQDPSSTDIWPGAHETSKEITKYLTSNSSPSGEPYTAVAVFKIIPDVSVIFTSTLGKDRDTAFEVSNLGVFSASTKTGADHLWQVGRVTFSRSSVVSGSAVTMSAVSGGDGGLTIGFSWQEGVVEDSVVDSLVDGVKKYLEGCPPTIGPVVNVHEDVPTKPIPYSQAAQLDSRIKIPRPIIDPALAPIIDSFPLPEELDINFLRGLAAGGGNEAFVCNADTILKAKPHLKHAEHSISAPDGNTVILSVFAPKEPTSAALAALYHLHGGGMVSGDRFGGVAELMDLLEGIECVVVSVEYRLAPETRAPGPAKDCHAGLVWISENAASLGVDPAEIVVLGMSGGAALAAATCLMARDSNSPAIRIKAQMLLSPMLDDRCDSVSDHQFEYGSSWCGVTNRMAWEHVLGDDRGTDNVTPYQSASRATDLSNLPPTYIDAAECEVFRDPAVTYAMNMWRCGSTCELHVWPGAFHLFDGMDNPDVPLIRAAIVAKCTWLKRIMVPKAKLPSLSSISLE